jgi:hypothetical protein
MTKLLANLAEVESLLVINRTDMPLELVHFLERRSYDKAAKLCEGGMSIARGTCGPKI